nr:RNA-directed DNA polymerase, eukaryota, reverse transcriptase zinc-binding domain protein [Tanacetum cinerariifolium]
MFHSSNIEGPRPWLGVDLPKRLSSLHSENLKVPFSREEINRAVWDCGGDRAPGPDGFTFAFFKHFWSIIEEDCFFLTSGLKINVQKSKLLGVGVDHEESSELASILGCEVAWKKCLASKEHDGLGVGSIFALNGAVMFKWIWRFKVTSKDLWVKVIKNIYGNSGRIGEASFPISTSSPCIAILKATKHLTGKGIDLLSLCKRKVGDGSSIFFWDDDCCGDRTLKLQFSRVYALDDAKSCSVVERLRLLDSFSVFRRPPRGGDELLQYTVLRACTSQVTLSSQKDGWIWSHGVSVWFCCFGSWFIDDVILDVDYVATRWNRLVPAKLNVFFWKLYLNRIPTRVNLDRRGIDIGSILCPVCDRDVETSNHLFFLCEMAVDLWVLVARWWELDIPVTSSVLEWVAWIDSARLPIKVRNCLDVVALTLMWSIWCFRNKLLFSFTKSVRAIL